MTTTVPTTADEITPEWMTEALTGRYPGVRVSAIDLTRVVDGTAQKLRYSLEFALGARHGAPDSLWVKGPFGAKGAEQGEAFANEVHFFRDLAPQLAINVPDCYHGVVDEETRNGVVVLEDLLGRDATFGSGMADLDADQVAAALTLQARYHARFWGERHLDGPAWLRPGGAIAGTGMVAQYFTLWDDAKPRPRFAFLTAAQRERDRSQRALEHLVEDLRDRPVCLLHGDSQHGNLFFEPDGTPGYLDWQHSMLGMWAFDVAGLVVPAMTVADRREHERDLIAHYLAELTAAGAQAPSFEEAWTDYARYAMWAFMWVMCPVTAHPEEVCSANSERACAAIDDLDTMRLLDA